MTTKDYKRTVLDMWTNPTEPHGLDAKASNSMWGTSKTWETWGILQILRTRFLELVTPHMLAKPLEGTDGLSTLGNTLRVVQPRLRQLVSYANDVQTPRRSRVLHSQA